MNRLPNEIVGLVINYLSLFEIYTLACVSSDLRSSVISQLDTIKSAIEYCNNNDGNNEYSSSYQYPFIPAQKILAFLSTFTQENASIRNLILGENHLGLYDTEDLIIQLGPNLNTLSISSPVDAQFIKIVTKCCQNLTSLTCSSFTSPRQLNLKHLSPKTTHLNITVAQDTIHTIKWPSFATGIRDLKLSGCISLGGSEKYPNDVELFQTFQYGSVFPELEHLTIQSSIELAPKHLLELILCRSIKSIDIDIPTRKQMPSIALFNSLCQTLESFSISSSKSGMILNRSLFDPPIPNSPYQFQRLHSFNVGQMCVISPDLFPLVSSVQSWNGGMFSVSTFKELGKQLSSNLSYVQAHIDYHPHIDYHALHETLRFGFEKVDHMEIFLHLSPPFPENHSSPSLEENNENNENNENSYIPVNFISQQVNGLVAANLAIQSIEITPFTENVDNNIHSLITGDLFLSSKHIRELSICNNSIVPDSISFPYCTRLSDLTLSSIHHSFSPVDISNLLLNLKSLRFLEIGSWNTNTQHRIDSNSNRLNLYSQSLISLTIGETNLESIEFSWMPCLLYLSINTLSSRFQLELNPEIVPRIRQAELAAKYFNHLRICSNTMRMLRIARNIDIDDYASYDNNNNINNNNNNDDSLIDINCPNVDHVLFKMTPFDLDSISSVSNVKILDWSQQNTCQINLGTIPNYYKFRNNNENDNNNNENNILENYSSIKNNNNNNNKNNSTNSNNNSDNHSLNKNQYRINFNDNYYQSYLKMQSQHSALLISGNRLNDLTLHWMHLHELLLTHTTISSESLSSIQQLPVLYNLGIRNTIFTISNDNNNNNNNSSSFITSTPTTKRTTKKSFAIFIQSNSLRSLHLSGLRASHRSSRCLDIECPHLIELYTYFGPENEYSVQFDIWRVLKTNQSLERIHVVPHMIRTRTRTTPDEYQRFRNQLLESPEYTRQQYFPRLRTIIGHHAANGDIDEFSALMIELRNQWQNEFRAEEKDSQSDRILFPEII